MVNQSDLNSARTFLNRASIANPNLSTRELITMMEQGRFNELTNPLYANGNGQLSNSSFKGAFRRYYRSIEEFGNQQEQNLWNSIKNPPPSIRTSALPQVPPRPFDLISVQGFYQEFRNNGWVVGKMNPTTPEIRMAKNRWIFSQFQSNWMEHFNCRKVRWFAKLNVSDSQGNVSSIVVSTKLHLIPRSQRFVREFLDEIMAGRWRDIIDNEIYEDSEYSVETMIYTINYVELIWIKIYQD